MNCGYCGAECRERLPCGHPAHLECAVPALTFDSRCPACSTPIATMRGTGSAPPAPPSAGVGSDGRKVLEFQRSNGVRFVRISVASFSERILELHRSLFKIGIKAAGVEGVDVVFDFS